MIQVKIFFPIFLILSIRAQKTIDFSSTLTSSEGVSVKDNIINIYDDYYSSGYRTDFRLTGTNIDKSILVSFSSTLYLDSLTLASTSKLTPLIIDKNCDVRLELRGISSLVDSASNENGGIIHLREGSKLTIYGSGTLNLMINKFVAINGENSTLLELNGGTIKIISTENSAGGIKLGGEVLINGPTFNYEAISGQNPAIEVGNSLIINSGTFNIKSGKGKIFQVGESIIMNSGILNLETSGEKVIEAGNSIYLKKGIINIKSLYGDGIKAEKNIYFGVKDENNSNLKINIESLNKGIEARGIEIYSGNISINSKGDGIKISNDICKNEKCSGECTCYMKIYGGDIFINSGENGIDSSGDIFIAGGKLILYGSSTGEYQPITQCGLLKITNGTIFAGGTNGNGGVIANTTQFYFIYNKHIDKNSVIQIYDNENNILILNITNPKDMEYLYFNYPYNFTILINDKKIDNSDENNIRTLISSEYEDLDNQLYSTISEKNSQKINYIASTTMQNKEQTNKEIIDDISTNPNDNIKTQFDKSIISSIPDNKAKDNMSTNLNQNIKEQEILSSSEISNSQNLKNHAVESSFPKQTIQTQINQNGQSTIPKDEPKHFLGKSTIPQQNSVDQDSQINISIIQNENKENIKEKDIVIDSEQIQKSDNTPLNGSSYDLSGFIRLSNILLILIELFLL